MAGTTGSVSLVATDLEAVDFCLRANAAGTGYAIGDQIKLTRWFNPSTNLQVSEVAFNMTQGGSSVAVPLTAANFDECPSAGGANETLVCAAGVTLIRRVDSITGAITFIGSNGVTVAAPVAYTIGDCAVNQTSTVEIFRIAGTAVGTSTPSIAPASVPVVGNTLALTSAFRALSWRWLRDTAQDPGTGLVAHVEINGFSYFPGSGPQYQETGWSVQASAGETLQTNFTFTAFGQAFIEIIRILD